MNLQNQNTKSIEDLGSMTKSNNISSSSNNDIDESSSSSNKISININIKTRTNINADEWLRLKVRLPDQ